MKTKTINKANVPFNKKNVLALADKIHSDKNGTVTFLKLCDNTLKNGKDGNRTLHCALGEAYWQFVNHDMRKVSEEYDDHLEIALSALTNVANLNKGIDKSALKSKLNHIMSINDSADDFYTRSEDVANFFRKEIVPLLK